MPYKLSTIEKAEKDEASCETCAYRNKGCPAKNSYTECSRDSGYPLWQSNRITNSKRRKEYKS